MCNILIFRALISCTLYINIHSEHYIALKHTCKLCSSQKLSLFIKKFLGDTQINYVRRNLTLYVPCIILQCVYKPTRCTNSYNQFYSTVFFLLYMFRTNLVVHHQEHGIIYCITQFGTIGTIVLSGESSCF